MKNLTSRQRLQSKTKNGDSQAQEKRPPKTTTRSNRPSATATATNPIGTILRKAFLLIARDVQKNPASGRNLITDFIIDVAIGTITGLLFILFLSFLDYRNIITFRRSGSRLVSAAHDLLTDPEWMQTTEDTIGVRFVDMDIYNAIKREISQSKAASRSIYENPEYQRAKRELLANQSELEIAKKQHAEVKAEALSKLGLSVEMWCGGCKAGFGNCDMRIEYLKKKHETREARAKMTIMSQGKCRFA